MYDLKLDSECIVQISLPIPFLQGVKIQNLNFQNLYILQNVCFRTYTLFKYASERMLQIFRLQTHNLSYTHILWRALYDDDDMTPSIVTHHWFASLGHSQLAASSGSMHNQCYRGLESEYEDTWRTSDPIYARNGVLQGQGRSSSCRREKEVSRKQ